MRALSIVLLVLVLGGGFVASQTFYIVDVAQQAVVTRLGNPISELNEPGSEEAGLHFKAPFFDTVVFFDKRNLNFDVPTEEIQVAGQERIVVDAFARYRITRPLRFYQSVRDEAGLENRLEPIMDASIRGVLGGTDPSDIVSGRRAELMGEILVIANSQAEGRAAEAEIDQANDEDLGIEIIDVRIRRADLPEANAERVFTRMNTEREQAASLIRAGGQERAQTIRAQAEREREEILATANQAGLEIRGQADARRNAVYAAAYGRDVEFFNFYRSMEAYRRSLGQGTEGDANAPTGKTTLLLSPDSDFFRYFADESGSPPPQN